MENKTLDKFIQLGRQLGKTTFVQEVLKRVNVDKVIETLTSKVKLETGKIPKLTRVHISEETLLDPDIKFGISELDIVVAYEPATGVFLTLVKLPEGPANFYCWRNMKVATFFLFSDIESRFSSIEDAIRKVVSQDDMYFEIYKLGVD